MATIPVKLSKKEFDELEKLREFKNMNRSEYLRYCFFWMRITNRLLTSKDSVWGNDPTIRKTASVMSLLLQRIERAIRGEVKPEDFQNIISDSPYDIWEFSRLEFNRIVEDTKDPRFSVKVGRPGEKGKLKRLKQGKESEIKKVE